MSELHSDEYLSNVLDPLETFKELQRVKSQLAATEQKLRESEAAGAVMRNAQLLCEKNAAQGELAVCCEDRDAAVLRADTAENENARLVGEVEKWKGVVTGDCEIEDIARKEASRELPALDVFGDSNGVPTIADVVRIMTALLKASRADLQRYKDALEKAKVALRNALPPVASLKTGQQIREAICHINEVLK